MPAWKLPPPPHPPHPRAARCTQLRALPPRVAAGCAAAPPCTQTARYAGQDGKGLGVVRCKGFPARASRPCRCAGLVGSGGPAGGIQLDRLLHGSLFNKKEGEAEGSVVPQAALLKRLLAKLQLHHRLIRPSEQASAVPHAALPAHLRQSPAGPGCPPCLQARLPPADA